VFGKYIIATYVNRPGISPLIFADPASNDPTRFRIGHSRVSIPISGRRVVVSRL